VANKKGGEGMGKEQRNTEEWEDEGGIRKKGENSDKGNRRWKDEKEKV
jgi:hypothetical protein